ncbi:MAG TPA: PhaM family polyhydroxyalkanoate granule multifunctional regulatory protein [Zeimonas sp.]
MTNSGGPAHPAPGGLPGLGIGALSVGNLLDTVEFVKNAWSSFGVPSALTPTTDVDELDRRIADLKAVEQWLTMNLNLLRASVQALEIQRGTIATLKAYGSMLPTGVPGAQALAQAMASAASGAMSAATGAAPLSGAASIPATTAAADAAQAAQTPAAEMAAANTGDAPPHTAPQVPGLDAGAWWELLHRQFNQIAAAALGAGSGGEAHEHAPAGGAGARAAREGAPVARSRKTPSGSKTQKTSSTGDPEPGRRGRRPAR